MRGHRTKKTMPRRKAGKRLDFAKNKLPSYLKDKRIKQGLTQVELGKRAGMTQSYIKSLETGVATPSHDSVERLATVLQLDPSEFYTAMGKVPPVVEYFFQNEPDKAFKIFNIFASTTMNDEQFLELYNVLLEQRLKLIGVHEIGG